MRYMIYEPLENFLVRIPILPLNFFTSSTYEKFIKDIIINLRRIYKIDQHGTQIYNLILDSLLVANKNFVENLMLHNPKMELYYNRTMLQYLIRMSTRTTPFGMFASVGICNFSNTFKLSFKNTTIFRARADIGWISKLVHKIETDHKLPNIIYLMLNPLHLEFAERVFILDSLPFSPTDKNIRKSIKKTEPINTIIKCFGNNTITFANLSSKLLYKYKDKKKVNALIYQLIKESFIITEMRPPLTNLNPLKYLYTKVKKGDIRNEIYSINKRIDILNELQYKNFLVNYREIIRSVDKIIKKPQTNYVRVENALLDPGIQLPKSIAWDTAELAELMLSLTTFPKGYNRIKRYKEKFIEKYGYKKRVNIVELLDDDLGLGSPYKDDETKRVDSPINIKPITNKILFKLISNSLKEHSMVVRLNDSDIDRIRTWIPNNTSAPLSMNININICVKNSKSSNSKEYQIVMSSTGGNREALRSISRVADVMGSPAYKLVGDIIKKEHKASKGYILTEVFAYPIHKEISDLEIHKPFYKYAIYLDQISNTQRTKQINLSDIYIGVGSDKFYIYSNELKSMLKIQNTTLMNEEMASEVMRFLIDISNNDQQPSLNHFNWGTARYMPFLPRLEYKKFILSLARWSISKDMNPELCDSNEKNFKSFLNKWRKSWMVPRFVYINEDYGSRFVIDLKSENHTEILYSKIKKLKSKDSLLIIEAFPYESGIRLRNNNKSYLAEFIIPLVKSHSPIKPVNKSMSINEKITNSFVKPTDWIFLKLYMKEDSEDEFIIQKISKIINLATKDIDILKWFFIRYADPNSHIRLRFKVKSKLGIKHILPILYQWLAYQVNRQQILRFSIDTYEREVERYGGKQGIESAERFFNQDSKIVINLLYNAKLMNYKDKIPICALSIDHMLDKMGMKIKDRILFYRNLTSNINYATTNRFTERLNILLAPIHPIGKNVLQDIIKNSFNPSISKSISDIGKKLKYLHAQNKLTVNLNDIIGSYLHMHCNRILSLKRENELETYILLKRYTEILYFNENKKNDKKVNNSV